MSNIPYVGQILRARAPFTVGDEEFPAGTAVSVTKIVHASSWLVITIAIGRHQRNLYVNCWDELPETWLIPVSPLEQLAQEAE